MSDDEVILGMSVPLDSDGFLRRQCPTCEREFKWLANTSDDPEQQVVPDGGYFCPYCGVQSPSDAWLTEAQIELAQNMVATDVVGPMLKSLGRDIENIGRRSGGFITASVKYDEPDKLDPLTESDDMKRVDFGCHPSEPVKVLDDWAGTARCLICGAPAA